MPHHGRPGKTSVMRERISIVLALVGVSGVVAVSGCSGFSITEKYCGGGEYPAIAVGPLGGNACFPDGQEPDRGYRRYPEGKVPETVGDKWDIFWRTHGVDEKGTIIPLVPATEQPSRPTGSARPRTS
jgi:hypothetical protein